MINSTLTGKQFHPKDISDKPGLKGLIREIRVLRWLAVSVRSELFIKLLSDNTSWPENATFFYLWTPVEDYITENATDKLLQVAIKHMSLHFDSIRVRHEVNNLSIAARKESIEQHVYNTTGYIINFNIKKHRSFFEWATSIGKL